MALGAEGEKVSKRVRELLNAFADIRVGVIGDFALDVYFELESETGEASIETGKPVSYGSGLVANLGGASSIVDNLHALGVGEICVFGATGDDILGHELLRSFSLMGVNADHFFVDAKLPSCAYVKPFVGSEEAPRIDFGTAIGPSGELKDRILEALSNRITQLDVVILNEQFTHPLLDKVCIEMLNAVITRHPDCRFCADFRKNGHLLRGAVVKLNVGEVAEILAIDAVDERDAAACGRGAQQVSAQTASPVLLTRGESGLTFANAESITAVPGIRLAAELDTVGAGDSVISAFAASIGAAATVEDALHVANAAAAVTVQKLRQTGTASADEILAVLAEQFRP